MDLEQILDDHEDKKPTEHRFAKLMLATIAGFIVTKLVEDGYDKLYERRNNKTEPEPEVS